MKTVFFIIGVLDLIMAILEWIKTNGDCNLRQAVTLSVNLFCAGWFFAYCVFK